MTDRATIVGVDPGTKRIGIAVADLETRFAHALEVIDAGKNAVETIVALARERGAVTIVVGRPVSLSGEPGPAVERQQRFVAELRAATDVPVEEYDERLTTVVAESSLRSAGADAKARKSARDAVAAQVLLQGYLDSTR